MSKTPYEIRLELLHLAQSILQTPVYQKRQIFRLVRILYKRPRN